VRIVGVDDFAWKKGQTYGTILVDLELHRPIDLLPERSEESLEAWPWSIPAGRTGETLSEHVSQAPKERLSSCDGCRNVLEGRSIA